MAFLTISTSLASLRPQQCSTQDSLCPHASDIQGMFLFVSLYMVDLGSGALQSVVTSLGADQFDEEDATEKVQKISFFNLLYQCMNVGCLIWTLLVYVQDDVSWGLGFAASFLSIVVGTSFLIAGAPFYRHHPPGGNPLTRIGQVIVASARKWRVKIPTSSDDLYEVPEEMESVIQGSRKIRHTNEFRFLDKAAVEIDGDKSDDLWQLCTVTQVEEFKVLVRMIPIMLSSAMFFTVYNQLSTLFIIQGATMDRQVGHFMISPASLTVIEILSVAIWVPIYDFVVIRYVSRVTKNLRGFTELQRIGMRLGMSMFAMVAAAMLEVERLDMAQQHGLLDHLDVPVPLSVSWQVPQYFLVGGAEVFTFIGIYECFYGESLDAIRGVESALGLVTIAMGMLFSDVLLTIATCLITHAPRWIADNLNRAHIDYYFWMLAGLNAANLVFYVMCARQYKTMQSWCPYIHGASSSLCQ